MKKLVFTILMTIACASALAHDNVAQFESEQQEVEAMLKADLWRHTESAGLLANSILSEQVENSKKCGYLAELKVVHFNLDLTIRDFERLAIGNLGFSGSMDISFDEELMHKKIFVDNFRSQWINYHASIQTFQKNLNCQ